MRTGANTLRRQITGFIGQRKLKPAYSVTASKFYLYHDAVITRIAGCVLYSYCILGEGADREDHREGKNRQKG
ncbi:MAG: hypothetical protein QF879_00040 [Candidatus Latescibacteria bacterium]|nr:hypothetical protein [Candidatus Latescibacterota bacterium]